MDQEQTQESSSGGFVDSLLADAPWQAKSVIAAAVATIAGIAAWVTNYSSPAVAGFTGSYIGGFFIGWAFRRFLKVAALIAGALITSIAALKSSGVIDLDWVAVENQVSQTIASVHQEAEGVKRSLSGFLPSAGAGAAGVFFGFRRR